MVRSLPKRAGDLSSKPLSPREDLNMHLLLPSTGLYLPSHELGITQISLSSPPLEAGLSYFALHHDWIKWIENIFGGKLHPIYIS